jgi:NitT/TauT family transport system permease protein/taurine transport system permease protein
MSAASAMLERHAGARGRRWSRRLGPSVVGAVPFATLVGVWYVLAVSGNLPRAVLPSPIQVAEALVDLTISGVLLGHIGASLARLAIGMVVSVVLGVGLGVLAGLNAEFAEFVEPPATFLNALSGIAWIPLAIAWFGIGPVAVTFILWNSIFFLVFFNTLVGVKRVPRVYEQALLTLGAGHWQIVRDVLLPGALPSIISGVRLGASFGWRALIAAEMLGTTDGLGFMIFNASYFFRSDVILAGILVIGAIWLVTDRLVLRPIEQATVQRWGLLTSEVL